MIRMRTDVPIAGGFMEDIIRSLLVGIDDETALITIRAVIAVLKYQEQNSDLADSSGS